MPRLTHEETRRRLTEGLLALIASRPLYEVQVRELCGLSGVSRSTFYKHYEGMEGFVHALEDRFIEQMDTALGGTNVFLLSISIDARETFSRCTEFMHSHARFVRPMIGPNGSPSLRGRILELWAKQVQEALSLLTPLVRPDLDVSFFAACTASAMLTLLELDLLNDGAYTPEYVAEQMAAIIYGCLLKEAITPKT